MTPSLRLGLILTQDYQAHSTGLGGFLGVPQAVAKVVISVGEEESTLMQKMLATQG